MFICQLNERVWIYICLTISLSFCAFERKFCGILIATPTCACVSLHKIKNSMKNIERERDREKFQFRKIDFNFPNALAGRQRHRHRQQWKKEWVNWCKFSTHYSDCRSNEHLTFNIDSFRLICTHSVHFKSISTCSEASKISSAIYMHIKADLKFIHKKISGSRNKNNKTMFLSQIRITKNLILMKLFSCICSSNKNKNIFAQCKMQFLIFFISLHFSFCRKMCNFHLSFSVPFVIPRNVYKYFALNYAFRVCRVCGEWSAFSWVKDKINKRRKVGQCYCLLSIEQLSRHIMEWVSEWVREWNIYVKKIKVNVFGISVFKHHNHSFICTDNKSSKCLFTGLF
jgi:hypothetical protein